MNLNSAPKLSQICVEKLRLRAYIGFMEWETKKLQDVVLSYSFKYNTAAAAKNDAIEDALNYKELTKEIIKLIDNQTFNLIEHLAEIVYQHILAFSPKIQNIEVKLEKPFALRFSDNVFVKISSEDRYNIAMITMGSNILPDENFEKALHLIQNLGTIVKRTEFIKTEALKFKEQPHFLNGSVLIYTQKTLFDLQIGLKQIEAMLGRVRSENKNAPREIDLDVTTYNNSLIDKEIHELPFIIDFLKQLQPEIQVPSL